MQAKKQRLQYLQKTRSGMCVLNFQLSDCPAQTAKHRLGLPFFVTFLWRRQKSK
jgi:hypothetical protein